MTANAQERDEIEHAYEAIRGLIRLIEGADRETLLSLLLALSVQSGALRDAAVGWYVALTDKTSEREG